MARPSLLPVVRGAGTAVVLAAAAGCGALDEATEGGAAARPAEAGSPPIADAGASGKGSRPGAPFDVEAFEQVGVGYPEFLESGADRCDGGRCTLSFEFFESSERASGCTVADFRYRPAEQPDPEHPGRFVVQRGAAVTVVVGCAPGEAPGEDDADTASRSPAA